MSYLAALASFPSMLFADTKFSVDRGFHDAPFSVTVSSDAVNSTITYTVDGSDPRTSTTAESGAAPLEISIDPGSTYDGRRERPTPAVTLRAVATFADGTSSNVDTQTYIFLDQVREQPNLVPNPDRVAWDSVMDPRVVNDPRYSDLFETAMTDIPTLSIVMDWDDLFGPDGIHDRYNLRDDEIEMPCSIELIYPPTPRLTGFDDFQVNGGIKMQGGGGRWEEGFYDPKQSFSLLFDPVFEGPGRLRHPFFASAPLNSDSAPSEHNRLILRAGSNKNWAGPGPNLRETVVYVRDEYARASQLQLSGAGTSAHGTFVHLYLNGLYWGLYNPTERPDHNFQSIYFGGDGDHYDSYKQRNGEPNGDQMLFEQAKVLAEDPETPYAVLKQHVDTASFADFMMIMWSGGAADGPQWYAGNASNPAGPVRFFTWDYEDSFTPPGTGRGGAGYSWEEENPLWQSIEGHPEFRIELADRIYRHCFNDGAFTDARNIERWLTLCGFIENAVIGESARWGDQGVSSWNTPDISGYTPPLNRDDHWYPARDQVTALLEGNTERMIADLRSRGYFPSIDAKAPLFVTNGNTITESRLTFTGSLDLSIMRDGDTGTIYWTANGPDPRAEGGTPRGNDGGTEGNLTFTDTTTIRARLLNGSEWSPLHEITLHRSDEDLSALKITEIMYHPSDTPVTDGHSVINIVGDAGGPDIRHAKITLADTAPGTPFSSRDQLAISGSSIPSNNGRFQVHRIEGNDVFLDEVLTDEEPTSARAATYLDGDRYEFIELKNTGSAPLNLSGVRITEGISYAFPEGTILEAGGFWLITPHRSNLPGRHPDAAIHGRYMGSLNNGGERVTLVDHADRVLTSVNYNDEAPWPLPADGHGHSLVSTLSNPEGDQNVAKNWRSSRFVDGSPGTDDPAPVIPEIKINEVLTHTDPPLQDAVELFNPTATVVDLDGWFLTDDRTIPQRWRIPDSFLIEAESHAVIHEGHYDEETLLFSENEFGSAFSLSALGEEIHLFSPDLAYSHGFEFEAAFNGVSFGRHVISTGEERFPAQIERTLGSSNFGPAVGPVVITEIHYHPVDGDFEFMKLSNLTNQAVPLHAPARPANTWKVGGIGFDFPGGFVLAANGNVLLVRGTPDIIEAFRAQHRLSPDLPIFNYTGALDNGGETLTLRRPDEPVGEGPNIGTVPYVVADQVRYDDRTPWPIEADGSGMSLQRIRPAEFGDDPANWRAGDVLRSAPRLQLTAQSDGSIVLTWETADAILEETEQPNGTWTTVATDTTTHTVTPNQTGGFFRLRMP